MEATLPGDPFYECKFLYINNSRRLFMWEFISSPITLVNYSFRYSNGKKRTVCYMHWPDGGFPTSKADYMSVISKLLLLWFILCVFVTAGKNVNLKMLFYSWRGGRGGFFSFTFSQWMGKVKAYPGTVNFKFFTDFSLSVKC